METGTLSFKNYLKDFILNESDRLSSEIKKSYNPLKTGRLYSSLKNNLIFLNKLNSLYNEYKSLEDRGIREKRKEEIKKLISVSPSMSKYYI
jgi:hypothetical protein